MKLRIAMLSIHSSPLGRMGTRDTGGMSVYVSELARCLAAMGHPVDIFTRWTPADGADVISPWPGVRIVFIGEEGWGALPKDALPAHAEGFAAAIDDFRREAGVAYHRIHSNYWLSGLVGEGLKSRWGCPHLITFHTLGAAKTAARDGHAELPLRLDGERRLVQECDGVIVPTDEERERIVRLCGGRREKVHVIPCGVDLARFRPPAMGADNREGPSAQGTARLLFVGRFDPMKGMETLLESLAHLPGAPAVSLSLIGGDGPGSPEQRRVSDRCRSLGVRVRFLGAVPHHAMPRHYHEADAVVVASVYESFGLVILESLAAGTPVASTRVGVAPYVIQPGVNGYLASAEDPRSLAVAVTRTLALARRQDPMKIRSTIAGFGWPGLASRLLDVYFRESYPLSGRERGAAHDGTL